MSMKAHFLALQEIQNWNVDDVLHVLNKNGLGECASAFKKRGIDGSSLLDLTEIKLALWKRDLNTNVIRKLSRFVQDLNQTPEKYVQHDNVVQKLPGSAAPTTIATTTTTTTTSIKEVQQQHPASLKGLLPTRSVSSSSYSDTGSWDTDFEDDLDESPSEKFGNVPTKENIMPTPVPVTPSKTQREKKGVDTNIKSSVRPPIALKANITPPVPKAYVNTVNNPPKKNKDKDNEDSISQKKSTFQPPTKNNGFSSKFGAVAANTKSFLYNGVTNFHTPLTVNNLGLVDSKPNVTATTTNVNKPSQVKKENVTNVQPMLKAPAPFRPPILTPKPVPPAVDKKWNLPKPPVHMQGSIENVKDLINNLNLSTMENKMLNDQGDDYYESFDGESFPDLRHFINTPSTLAESNSLQTLGYPVNHSENNFSSSSLQESSDSHLKRVHSPISSAKHSTSPVPQVESNTKQYSSSPLPGVQSPAKYMNSSSSQRVSYGEEIYEVCDETVPPFNETGYESEEYEFIEDHLAAPPISGDGSEYYLQPVTQKKQMLPKLPSTLTRPEPPKLNVPDMAPPLPAKPRLILSDVVVPTIRPLSPPQTNLDDNLSSAGSSADGTIGKFGALIGKVLNRTEKPNNTATEVRKKTPTPDPKKTPVLPPPSNKPPLVDQRPVATSNAQGRPLPLPPTREGTQEKSTASSLHRTNPRTAVANMPWFHDVDRRKGEELLKNGDDGCFLVRPSTQSQNPLTLTLRYNKRLYNIVVRQRTDGRYALGTVKAKEQSFVSVEELIAYYQSENLVLHSAGERTGTTLLTSSPRREP